jgi:nucleoside-diphosphate-sugar epimerase
MNVVLTGHMGLIGHFLKRKIVAEGYDVVTELDRTVGSELSSLSGLIIDKKIDLMIHSAAHCKINESISNPEKTFNDNVLGVFHVLEFCRANKIPKIVFFSSSRILSPEKNPYTASKVYGEELCKSYCRCYGIEYVIIRPSTVYGPFWDKTERLIHKFIVNALGNKSLEIFGNPETKTLDFTYIDDFIDGVMIAMKKKNKEFDISGGGEYNVYKLAQFIISETESSGKIVVYPKEIEQPQQVSLDLGAIRSLGYRPRFSVEEGVRKTIEWYRNYLKFK